MADQLIKLCVFNSREGTTEGQEHEKIIYFFPESVSIANQITVVGLSEGLISFTRIFTSDNPRVCSQWMESDQCLYTWLECETDIWIVLVIQRKTVSSTDVDWPPRNEALRQVLKEFYSIFTLFYGPISSHSTHHASQCLAATLPHYFQSSRWRSSCHTLQEAGTVVQLSLRPSTLLHAQSLAARIQLSVSNSHTVILFHNLLLTTTLPLEETAAIATYASHFLTASLQTMATFSLISSIASSNPISIPPSSPSQSSAGCHPACSSRSEFHPLKPGAWHRGNTGFLEPSTASSPPTFYLGHSNSSTPIGWSDVCIFTHKALTVLSFVPSCSQPGNSSHGESLTSKEVITQMRSELVNLEHSLSEEYSGPLASHVPGYRYLHVHSKGLVSHSSPQVKLSTLTRESLGVLNSVRKEVDLHKYQSQLNDSPGEFELFARSQNGSWVICRSMPSKESDLYVAMDRAPATFLQVNEFFDSFVMS